MRRLLIAMVLSMCASGCPESRTPDDGPDGTSAAAPVTVAAPRTAAVAPAASSGASTAASLEGGWTVEVTSKERSAGPAAAGTPAERAKRLFDHAATVEGGKVRVDQRTLGQHWLVGDAAQAVALERLVRALDWKKMKLRTSLEEAQAGGTIFSFKVTVGADRYELETGNLEAYPDLVQIVTTLKKTAGVP